ncbi:tol protein [Stemphylium lycopersici]|uniref:Tol protein n=1 Tax=Stemphylium lycopersici TaxID=183478 RepID=A0A364N529_STELY|nr:tol protein [Stemphylium lycopersici]RAR01033.1 tol protein [Stemphylium lycopersici]RAR12200.1 tol protein [Stemphylium lycopersici]
MVHPPPQIKFELSAVTDPQLSASVSNDHSSPGELSETFLDRRNGVLTPELSTLCSRCKQIDFEAIFYPRKTGFYQRKAMPETGNFITELGDLVTSSDCATCRLFSSVAVGDLSGDSTHHLRTFDATKVFSVPASKPRKLPLVALSVVGGRTKKQNIFTARRCEEGGFILAERKGAMATEQNMEIQVSRIQRLQPDFQKIGAWFLHCETEHAQGCGLTKMRRLSVPLPCIDCYGRSIVKISPKDEYYALSYVWGASEASACHFTEDGRVLLPHGGASQVVEDAILAVQKLGQRYLWVDQYCIDQLDAKTKKTQLREMDQIYEGAYATILAVAGTDAEYGLPGISRRREQQPLAILPSFDLISSLPDVCTTLETAKWSTRGWTYQEAMLSRRCLIFTDQQVHFVCSRMSCCEAVSVQRDARKGRDSSSEIRLLLSLGTRKFDHGVKPLDQLSQFCQHVRAFSGRDLTHEEDRLDAFRGMLSRSPFQSYFGIPVAPCNDAYQLKLRQEFDFGFARGLLWVPRKPRPSDPEPRRNKHFPSWSWAGWSGPVGYDAFTSGIEHMKRVAHNRGAFSGAEFWIEESDGKHTRLWDVVRAVPEARMLPERSHILVLDCHIVRLTAEADRNNVSAYECPVSGKTIKLREFARFYDCNDGGGRNDHAIRDGLVVFTDTIGRSHIWMLDWVGDVAQVVGHVNFKIWKLPAAKRRIRLA